MKVLGMGNALVDVLAKIEDDKVLESLALPKGAMTLIDEKKFQQLSYKLDELHKSIVSGGSASNTIVGLSNLAIDSGFIGRIGNDTFGQIYKEDLLKYNVYPHLIEVEETSGVASTFISKDGQRTFGTYLGAAAMLNTNDLASSIFEGYDIFYIEGYLVQSHALIEKAIKLAKEAGMKVALDLASYNVVEENFHFLLKIVPQYVDILFSNEEEAKAMTGLAAEKAVSKLAELVELAIVKAGVNGSWVQSGETKVHVPAHEVVCVDSTGAGDLYAAGFLYGFITKQNIKTCATLGTILAEEVIQVIGPKIPDNRWDVIKEQVAKLKK